MKLGIAKERRVDEQRVAMTPESVKRLKTKGFDIIVEHGAGLGAALSDDDYSSAGAQISNAADVWQADGVIKIQPPTLEETHRMKENAWLACLLYANQNKSQVEALHQRKVSMLALEKIPRTTLAQMMDVLSSQASIAGYRAVILAAEALPKLFPMMMTAAGTITPARVLVLGAGVAGLQAVATARRLGAVVEVFDVRKVVKEQVESLGARFIEVPVEEDAQAAGGYAKEVSDAYKQKQRALIAEHIAKADVCITTALIPGQPAPKLVDASMAKGMRRGSVLIDMAAEQGGNCELTRPGDRIKTEEGVTIVGDKNLASQMAVHASQMFSRNIEKLIQHVFKSSASLDRQDPITQAIMEVSNG